MTIFELVKVALDQLYSDGKDHYGDKLDKKIVKALADLTASYNRLRNGDRKPIDYGDPAIRFAYVFKYVAAHGDYIVQVMERLRAKLGKAVFPDGHVRVSCVGGGPGSDIIAILKYLDEAGKTEHVTKVICYLLDAEQAWADAWTELDESLHVKVALNTNFQPLDVTNSDSWQQQKKFLQADLFTMSYFVSEVMSLDKKGVVTKFWKQLIKHAKPGCMFLYIDNGSDVFNNYIDKLATDAKLKTIISQDNVRFIPRFSEQASELADYRVKFEHYPKIQSTLSYRVLRKPT